MFGMVFQSILTKKKLLFRLSKKMEDLSSVWFSYSVTSPIEKIIINKNCLYPIEDNDFLSANFKRYFTSDHFL